MQTHSPQFLRAVAAMTAAGALCINAHAQCNINMAATQQTIDGFGFSSAWCGTLTSAKNNALYNTLGMSLLRVQVDPSGNWTAEINNANAAHAAGAKVLGSVWHVPGQWNNSSGHLDPANYDNYGRWLNEAANAHGLDWVSPANEPDLGWQPWTQSELMAWICQSASLVGKPIVAPEAVNWSESYSNPFYEDSCTGSKISIAAGHLYGGGVSVHSAALNRGKRVWATEYYFGGPNNIDTCMTEAKQITDCMYNQFSAYILWWVNDSDTDTLIVDSNGNISKTGYTFGQFAKWIRPGSTRVTADYNPQSNVYVTAYKVNNGTVIVAVNMNTYSVNQQFNIQNGNAATLQGYRTSSSQNMSDIGSFTVSGGSFTASLPAKSVTTFVQTSSGTSVSGGTYKLLARHSGKALEAAGNGTSNGTQIQQWTYVGGASQQWSINSVGNGQYSLIGVQSGKCIDINNAGTSNGTKVHLWDYFGGAHQKFTFTATSSGYYRITPTHATGSCLDVSGPSTSDGAVVHLWQWLNANNQQWLLQPVDSTVKLVARHSGKAMDAYGAQTANGTQIIQWSYGGGNNQKWTLTDSGSGNYRILGVQSGKSLDVNNAGTGNGTKVQLWDYFGGAHQLFKFTGTDPGYFRITPTHATASSLSVESGSTADGAKVWLWQYNGNPPQQWSPLAP